REERERQGIEEGHAPEVELLPPRRARVVVEAERHAGTRRAPLRPEREPASEARERERAAPPPRRRRAEEVERQEAEDVRAKHETAQEERGDVSHRRGEDTAAGTASQVTAALPGPRMERRSRASLWGRALRHFLASRPRATLRSAPDNRMIETTTTTI